MVSTSFFTTLRAIALPGFVLFFHPLTAQAQAPEQDCSGAIVLTSATDTFSAYASSGQTQELFYLQNTSCLIGGEENSVWITFTVCNTGILTFEIMPDVYPDDFDWALYDFTNHTCSDVLDTTNQLRCNYSAIPGWTGLDTQYVMISVGSGGPNQCAAINAYSQQRFLLVVNNHSQMFHGFTMQFNGTATLCTTVGVPEMINNNFFLSPNPTNGTLQLKNLPAKNNLVMEVLNVYGDKVYERELKRSSDNQLSLSPLLPDGFYVLRILQEGKLFGEESFILSR